MAVKFDSRPVPGKPDEIGRASLWSAFARSVTSNLAAEIVVQVIRIGGFVILARALEPEDFGILRVLVAISMVAMMLNTAGIPEALIQRQEVTPEQESTAWWITVGTAVGSGCLLYLSAPMLARLMAMPSLAPFVRIISIPILFSGTSAVANARLRRRLQFSALAAADVLAEFAFLLVALTLLAVKLNHWSLACALAARIGTQAAAVLIAESYLPRGAPTMKAAEDLFGFSSTVLGARMLVVLAGNADYLMVGRLLGSSALGFYGMAWDLLRFVPDRLYSVVGRVTLPAFCLMQDHSEALAETYTDFINYFARIILPILSCVALAAPELIEGVYGTRWLPAAAPMRLLAAGLALAGMRMAIGSVYYARGKPSFDIYVHSVRLFSIVIVIALLAPHGLLAVSAGMGAVEICVSLFSQWLVCHLTGLTTRKLVAAVLPGLQLAMFCAAGVLAAKMIVGRFGIGNPWALIITIACPAVIFCCLEASTASRLVATGLGRKGGDSVAME